MNAKRLSMRQSWMKNRGESAAYVSWYVSISTMIFHSNLAMIKRSLLDSNCLEFCLS